MFIRYRFNLSFILIATLLFSAAFCGQQSDYKKIPIIYHKNYNISLFGFQRLHPFDTCKYGKIYNYLVKEVKIKPEQFYTPEEVSDADLLKVHSKKYLASLCNSRNIFRIAELDYPYLGFFYHFIPNFLLKWLILKPMRLATGGTILGANLALTNGWAINLSGGYHHAKRDVGSGFCYYADIPLAAYKIFEKHPDYNILIVDLDAHQGNGHESILGGDKRIHIFDVYNEDAFPWDVYVMHNIEFRFPIPSQTSDDKYLSLLQKELPVAVEKTKPNLIIYNAGTDILQNDPIGHLNVSENGIIQRDEFVFKMAKKYNVPILMVLSGGYTQASSSVISKSIKNILTTVIRPDISQYQCK
jgi:histone deacetylase 11